MNGGEDDKVIWGFNHIQGDDTMMALWCVGGLQCSLAGLVEVQ